MKVTLQVVKGLNIGLAHEFNEPYVFLVGRSKDAAFRLPHDDPYVSRRHFFLEICPPKCVLKDLNSTNPPQVNKMIVEEADLCDGDEIIVGYTHLKVSIEEHVATNRVSCRECGKSCQIVADGSDSAICADCLGKRVASKKQQEEAIQNIRCRCGKEDFTERANCDGRAGELMGLVEYACKKCLPEIDKKITRNIGKYRVLKELGGGGMGTVFLVQHTPTGRILALKQIKDLSNEQLIKRFQREAFLLQEIVHPNLIRYVDASLDAKEPYLVMILAPDGDLDKLVEKHGGALPMDLAISLIADSLDGLACIHARDIVHRDLKPGNILLRTSNGRLIPQITDFGLAKKYSEAGGTVLTKQAGAMGTPFFMAPEQIIDARTVKEPADLFSMGVTLYYLLTGRLPYDFPSPHDIDVFLKKNRDRVKNLYEAMRLMQQIQKLNDPLKIVLDHEPKPIRQQAPHIPEWLADVVDKSVKKDIKSRFQTAVEFKKALQR